MDPSRPIRRTLPSYLSKLPGPDVVRGRQFLRADRCAVERELVVALIADGQVKRLVEAEDQPAREVVFTGGQVVQDDRGTAERLCARIVGVAPNRQPAGFRFSGIHVVREDDVDEIRASILQEVGVQRQAEHTILGVPLDRVGDRQGHGPGAVGGVDAHDALAASLGHPQAPVGSPPHLPGIREACRDDAHRESFGARHRVLNGRHKPRDEEEHPEGRHAVHFERVDGPAQIRQAAAGSLTASKGGSLRSA